MKWDSAEAVQNRYNTADVDRKAISSIKEQCGFLRGIADLRDGVKGVAYGVNKN